MNFYGCMAVVVIAVFALACVMAFFEFLIWLWS